LAGQNGRSGVHLCPAAPSLAGPGFNLISQDSVVTPGVITIALPPSQNSTELGQQLQKAGIS